MKQMIRIIRKSNMSASYKEALAAEQDYLLDSLYQAMNTGDAEEVEKCKARLTEISEEMNTSV